MPGRKRTLEEVGKGWREHRGSFGKFGEVSHALYLWWRVAIEPLRVPMGSRSRPGTPPPTPQCPGALVSPCVVPDHWKWGIRVLAVYSLSQQSQKLSLPLPQCTHPLSGNFQPPPPSLVSGPTLLGISPQASLCLVKSEFGVCRSRGCH